MKKLLVVLATIASITLCYGATETITWHVDDQTYTTTCESGGDIALLTPTPAKRGYVFKGWKTYQQIEYLQSTGTQYIDTGIVPGISTNVQIKFSTNRTNSNNALFGSRLAYNNKSFSVWIYGGYCFRIDIDNGETCFDQLVSNSIYTLDFNSGNVYLNNNYILSYTPSAYSEYPMFIFNINNAGTTWTSEGYSSKIYYFKAYNNNILVRDFVPALDGNGVACMYDKVSKQFFYNAGTGDFIAGPIVQ